MLAQLRDLIAALDRRLPQVARAGEASIVRAAAALREEACKRIAELEGEVATAAAPILVPPEAGAPPVSGHHPG